MTKERHAYAGQCRHTQGFTGTARAKPVSLIKDWSSGLAVRLFDRQSAQPAGGPSTSSSPRVRPWQPASGRNLPFVRCAPAYRG